MNKMCKRRGKLSKRMGLLCEREGFGVRSLC